MLSQPSLKIHDMYNEDDFKCILANMLLSLMWIFVLH